MPKHKTLTVLERRIEETQASLMRAKARYDRLTQELQALHIEHDRVRAETGICQDTSKKFFGSLAAGQSVKACFHGCAAIMRS